MADFIIGPGYGWIGDPTVALGAGMTQLPEIATFSFDAGIAMAFATSPLNGGSPDADGIYTMPPESSATVTFNRLGVDELLLLLPGAEKFTQTTDDIIGFGGAIEKVVPDTFVFIPAFEAQANAANPHNAKAFWFPAGFFSELSDFNYGALQRNAASNSQFRTSVRAARRTTDQDSQALPQKAQYSMYGVIGGLNLTTPWLLPALVP